jgi:hypothetical protein
MNITLTIKTSKTLNKEQIAELTDSVLAYAEEVIDDLTFLDDENDSEPEPKPKKVAKAKKAAKPAKKKGEKDD